MWLPRRLGMSGNPARGDGGAVQPRDRLQQPPRVGVRRPLKQVPHRGDLDDVAGVHHGDLVGQVADDAEIVADIDDRAALLFAQGADHLEQPRLGHHIEARSRLIQDQDGRIKRQRHRNRDALVLAAAELMRVAAEHGDVHRQLRPRPRRAKHLGPLGARRMADLHRFRDLTADSHPRAQRARRVLRHESDRASPPQTPIVGAHGQNVGVADAYGAGRDARSRSCEAEQRHGQCGLAAARFADNPKDLAARQGEIDAGHELGAGFDRAHPQPSHHHVGWVSQRAAPRCLQLPRCGHDNRRSQG